MGPIQRKILEFLDQPSYRSSAFTARALAEEIGERFGSTNAAISGMVIPRAWLARSYSTGSEPYYRITSTGRRALREVWRADQLRMVNDWPSLRDRLLSPVEHKLLTLFNDSDNPSTHGSSTHWYRGHDYIASRVGLTGEDVVAALPSMVDAGWVKQEGNCYAINPAGRYALAGYNAGIGVPSHPEKSETPITIDTTPVVESFERLMAQLRAAAPPDLTLRELQTSLPWSIRYSQDFRANPQSHKDFAHALVHIGKASGMLFALTDDMDHRCETADQGDLRERYGKYLADLVVCSLRAANTFPGGVLDLQRAVEDRIEDKNGVTLPRRNRNA